MKNTRLIARLDVKGKNLIKGVHLEGLRIIGDPQIHATQYYQDGVDEIIFMDTVASLYGRNNLSEIVERTAENVFIPITVGGGVRSISDVRELMKRGADKIAINTAAVENPNLISEIASIFGQQCVVLSVEALKNSEGGWSIYTSNGREKSKFELLEWVNLAVELGAGEILLTSIDFEGTNKGFDIDLLATVNSSVDIPIIISGGMGQLQDVISATSNGADAIAVADLLHYKKFKMSEIKEFAKTNQLNVRL
ncbi:imidazole glycerol phosphate synthase cyclase subunit [Gammaproteobacteria bacterium]|jgi:imidazole glycerol-phosphate synthase subunit HisF|nr:imidazole glycerol phosphate synthase cyclase subunit [Gammaproteobacteria bacterium]MDC0090008.1 imidazole glycerol phosphate synthase cyclase subunit [Gammaproteobacteria bacterium]